MTFSTVRSSTCREWSESTVSNVASANGLLPLIISGVMFCSSSISLILYVQVLHKFRVCLNKVLTQFYFCSHKLAEDCVGPLGIIQAHLDENPVLWVHGSLP